jgi:hypothetical protein
VIYMADRRIQIARAVAQVEQLKAELRANQDEHSAILVRASKMEADRARLDAERARMMSQATAEEAERSQLQAAEALQREELSAGRHKGRKKPTRPGTGRVQRQRQTARQEANLSEQAVLRRRGWKTCNCARPKAGSW